MGEKSICKKENCINLNQLRYKESLIIVTIINDIDFKMEFGSSLTHTASYVLKDFDWISAEKEKGVLSNTKKRILYASIHTDQPKDCLKLKNFCDYIKGLKGKKTYYRFGETDELYPDWEEYAIKLCGHIPTPKELNYKLEINKYGNVDAFNVFPDGWHKTTLTVTQIKKLKIPYYKACIDFIHPLFGSHVKPNIVNIIPDDFTEQEENYIKELKEKENQKLEKINSMELTKELIAKCLYSINKEAKRKRDIQSDSIDRAFHYSRGTYPAAHYQLHKAKWEKFELYDLKEKTLDIAIELWNLKPDGYHEFPDMNRDMYTLEGYTFHVNENQSDICLGKITNEIDAKRKRGIPPKKAVLILKRFIKEHQK